MFALNIDFSIKVHSIQNMCQQHVILLRVLRNFIKGHLLHKSKYCYSIFFSQIKLEMSFCFYLIALLHNFI